MKNIQNIFDLVFILINKTLVLLYLAIDKLRLEEIGRAHSALSTSFRGQ